MLAITVLAPPGCGGKPIERGEIDGIGIWDGELTKHELPHMLGENSTSRMNRLVTIEALPLQTLKRIDDRRQVGRQLALNCSMNHGVERRVRQIDSGAPMILLYE